MGRDLSCRLPARCALLGLAAFIAACGGGGGNSGTGPNPPPSGGEPHPLNVAVTLDQQRAVSAPISPDGGSLTATAADGTQFTLQVPAGALIDSQTLGLTPVASIQGLPFSGGLIDAVQLEPEGLGLSGPATLTLRPPATLDAKAVGFGYQGQGQDFHLEPVQGTSTMVFTLTHFSGYGDGSGSPSDASAVVPATAEDRAMHDLGEMQGANHSGTWSDAEVKRLEEIFLLWYTSSVAPNASAAETDETKLDAAGDDWFAWIVWLSAIFGDLPPPGTSWLRELVTERETAGAALARGYTNAINNALAKCSAEHDLSRIKRMITLSSKAQRITLGYGFDRDLSQRNANKCASFELDFQSELQGITAKGGRWISKVGSVMPLQPNSMTVDSVTKQPLIVYQGTAPLRFDQVFLQNGSPQECTDPAPHPSVATLTVLLVIKLANDTRSAELRAAIDPDSPSENTTQVCTSGGQSTTIDWPPFWSPAFRAFHGDEFDRQTGLFAIKDWSMLFDVVFAEKTYVRTHDLAGGTAVENTSLQLKHTPQ